MVYLHVSNIFGQSKYYQNEPVKMRINQASAKGQEKLRVNPVTFASRWLYSYCLASFKELLLDNSEFHKKMLFVFINCSFDSPANQAMSKKIVSEVRSVYGKKKWEKSVIKGKFPENFICICLFTLEAPTLRCTWH